MVEAAELVTVIDEAIAPYAASLGPELAAGPAPASPIPDPGLSAVGADAEARAARVLTLDAINFGSGYHDHLSKDPGLSGARSMAARWERALDDQPVPGWPDPGWLTSLGSAGCARLLGQSLDHPDQAELMDLFAIALADLGTLVTDTYGGSYLALIEQSGGSAQTLAQSLLAMPFYRDQWPPAPGQGPTTVYFYKRAQITAADLARAFNHQPPARFSDLAALTAFADNLVPHVLRVDGVLDYHPELARTIDRGEPLALGSRAEIEIRAAGVEVVERLVATLAQAGTPTRAMDVDLALWTRGGGGPYKAVPRHRCRSTFY